MKVFLLKLLNTLATSALVFLAILSLTGLATVLPTGWIIWLENTFPFTGDIDIILSSSVLGGISAAGGTIKLVTSAVKKATNVERLKMNLEMETLREELHDTKAQFVDVVEVLVPHINELKTLVRESNKLLELNKDFNIISAERNLSSSDMIVPADVKNKYLSYIKSASTNREFKINNINAVIHKYEAILEESPKEDADTSWKL